MELIQSLFRTLTHPFNRAHPFRTIFRILCWKLNQRFFALPTIIEIEKGMRCVCYPDSSYGGMVVYSRWPDYEVTKKITTILKSNSVYIDVGANIGVMTLAAAAETKGKIIAFEPSSIAHPRLLENLALNQLLDRIIVEPLAVSDTNGYLSFSDEQFSELSHISPQNSGTRIKSCTLDSYLTKRKISQIDVLKADVEGAELSVLKGAAGLLTKKAIKHILLELNPYSARYESSNSESINYLSSFGYKIINLATNKRLVPGNLPASFDKRIINIYAKAR